MSSRPTDPGADPCPSEQADRSNTQPEPLGGTLEVSVTAVEGPAQAIPGYEILGTLGRGGMGVVYRARHAELRRLVALKVILAGGHAGEGQRARFRSEALVVARLQHPNIVQIYEVGEHDGCPYFSLELVDGGSLDKKLNATPQPARESARIVATLAQAMQAAHEAGIIHRDLKPANVLLTQDGQPKITDFGLAKQLDDVSGQTRTGDIMGTPSYMAPEQALGKVKEFGPVTDVYALGAILYEMLTGRPPFRSDSAMDTLLQAVSEEPVPPTRLNPKVPRDLETICLKCLEKSPAKRYATAAALAEELGRFLAGEPIVARPVGRGERLIKWARRRPAAAALVAVTVCAALAFLGTILSYSADLRKQRDIAKANEQVAVTRERQAQEAEERAQEALRLAEERASDLRRRVYGANIYQAFLAYSQGQTKRASDYLRDLRPAAGQPDLRGFEWNLLTHWLHLEQATLAGPGGKVRAVAFLPDGRGLLAANTDGSVVLREASGRERQITLDGHHGTAKELAISPDGRLLAEGYSDSTVKLWELPSGKLRADWKTAHRNGIRSMAFGPDGQTLATGGYDSALNLWHVKDGTKRAGPWKGRSEVIAIAFSPDGSLIASGGAELVVRLWETATGAERTFSSKKQSYTYCLAFAPDGKTLVRGTSGTVQLWDVSGGEVRGSLPLGSATATSLAFNSDGKALAVGTGFGPVLEIQIWDPESRQQRRRGLLGHLKAVEALAFAGTDMLASASADGTVKVWDLRADLAQSIYAAKDVPVHAVAFDPSGRTLAVTAGNIVQLLDMTSRRVRTTLGPFRDPLLTVAFSPDGKWLAIGEGVWPTGRRDEDKRTVSNTVTLWDAATGKMRATLKGHTGGVFSVAFSPDGRLLASGAWDRTVRLWDTATGEPLSILKGHTRMVRGVAFSPDGKLLAAACGDRWFNVESELRLWDVGRGEEVARLSNPGPVLSVAFSPDGKTLAAAVQAGTVKLWDVKTRKERMSLEPGMPVHFAAVAFSPDGRTVVGSSLSASIWMWHHRTGQLMGHLPHGQSPVSALAFSPNGHWLASADWAGTVKLWNGSPPTGD